ncbi:MAG: hypothetical protein LH491_06345 [Pseudoxanthomonas sp.]|nr:hypothetical protein [Pseudoxanthomonas sp.]
MSKPTVPALRPLLTLLLAALLLVQASTVLAMRSSVTHGASETAAVDPPSPSPICHDAPSAPSDPHSVPSDCCGDGLSGSYCKWACALTLSVVGPPDIMLGAPAPSVALSAATPLEPRWLQSRIMRPPIG